MIFANLIHQNSVPEDFTVSPEVKPDEHRLLERRLEDLARRVRYIEERLQIVQREGNGSHGQ